MEFIVNDESKNADLTNQKSRYSWTGETELLTKSPTAKTSNRPKITIVTPSYNQGKFIEKTILSVVQQGYPNLEYIVIDGGSNDNTLEIINKYQDYLDYWVSEPDRGQAHAINKGLEQATGDIIAFLNSDDLYLPETLSFVANFFTEHPEIDFICGQTEFINQKSQPTSGFADLFKVEINDMTMTETCHIAQPSTFFRASAYQKNGNFNESLHYCFDYDFWLRAYLNGAKFATTNQTLSQFRIHDNSKTNTAYTEGKFDRDFIQIYQTTLATTTITNAQKKGLRNGLAIATALLFIHLESSNSLPIARFQLWQIIRQTPEIFLSKSIWRTLLVSLLPNFARQTWQQWKQL